MLERGVGPLYRGYFNAVLATGIVSNGFLLLGQRTLSAALVLVGLAAYPLLVLLLALRAVLCPRPLWRDLVDPRLVFTFFTFVAASDVFSGSGSTCAGRPCGDVALDGRARRVGAARLVQLLPSSRSATTSAEPRSCTAAD